MSEKERHYRKDVELFLLLEKMKLWPARGGLLHGIRKVEQYGELLMITTHCGETFKAYNSRTSRAARWLRNKWVVKPCPRCKVPQWKIDKYSKTYFERHYGSSLRTALRAEHNVIVDK